MRGFVVCWFFGLVIGVSNCSSDDMEDCQPEPVACGDASACAPLLSGLSVSGGTLSPAFSPERAAYMLWLPNWLDKEVQVTPTVSDPAATLLVNGNRITMGTASVQLPVTGAGTMISVVVQLPGKGDRLYGITVMHLAAYCKASNT